MKETTKKVKNDVLRSIHSAVGNLFKESEKAEQLTYKSNSGEEARECPGAYSVYMTNLMIRDMMQLSLLLTANNKEASDAVRLMAKTLEDKDLAVRRMFDDRKDHRPVIEYPYDDTAKVIRDMSEVAKEGSLESCLFKPEEDQIKAWITRLMKVDIMAYYVTAHETLDKILSEADMQVYDENNNLVHGLDEKDAESVKIIAAMEQILLKALSRIPADSEEVQPTLGRIEIIEALLKAIINEDEEMLERMEKAAKAAKDFSEENTEE